MNDIDKGNSLIGLIIKSALALTKVFFIMLIFIFTLYLFLNSFEFKESINSLLGIIDLLVVIFILGFLCDIPFRIYLAIKAKK